MNEKTIATKAYAAGYKIARKSRITTNSLKSFVFSKEQSDENLFWKTVSALVIMETLM